jgi:uncharacterized phage-associated protein
VFFAKNTRYCGKIKLFKLLYLLDFDHFKETGRSVTGAEYSAWKLGPVPVQLDEEWEAPSADFSAAVDIVPTSAGTFIRQEVRPKVDVNEDYFTPRQLKLMDGLARKYRDTTAPEMIDVTHAENGAWARIWADGAGRNNTIPYELAINSAHEYADAIRSRSSDDANRETALNFIKSRNDASTRRDLAP